MLFTYINRHAATAEHGLKHTMSLDITQLYLKKNQNTSTSSEHPLDRGKKMSKRLGRIIGCKDTASSWHLIGFLDGSNIRSTVSWRGETRRYTVHLH